MAPAPEGEGTEVTDLTYLMERQLAEEKIHTHSEVHEGRDELHVHDSHTTAVIVHAEATGESCQVCHADLKEGQEHMILPDAHDLRICRPCGSVIGAAASIMNGTSPRPPAPPGSYASIAR